MLTKINIKIYIKQLFFVLFFGLFGFAGNVLALEKPTDVTATLLPSGRINISWTAPPTPPGGTGNPISYLVYRYVGTSIIFVQIVPFADIPMTATSFEDTSTLSPGVYHYRVGATYDSGATPLLIETSNEISNNITIPIVSLPPPATLLAPTNVAAVLYGSSNETIRITWQASVGATGYNIYRSLVGSSVPATQIGNTTLTQFDNPASSIPATGSTVTYAYTVQAVNLSAGTVSAQSTPATLPITIGQACTGGASVGSCWDNRFVTCNAGYLVNLCPGTPSFVQCCNGPTTPVSPPPPVGLPPPVGPPPPIPPVIPPVAPPPATTTPSTIGGFVAPTISSMSSASVRDILTNLLQWTIGMFGLFAVGAFVFAGFQYLTAGGDTGRLETAKTHMIWSIVGVVVALSGIVIIRAIAEFLAA